MTSLVQLAVVPFLVIPRIGDRLSSRLLLLLLRLDQVDDEEWLLRGSLRFASFPWNEKRSWLLVDMSGLINAVTKIGASRVHIVDVLLSTQQL